MIGALFRYTYLLFLLAVNALMVGWAFQNGFEDVYNFFLEYADEYLETPSSVKLFATAACFGIPAPLFVLALRRVNIGVFFSIIIAGLSASHHYSGIFEYTSYNGYGSYDSDYSALPITTYAISIALAIILQFILPNSRWLHNLRKEQQQKKKTHEEIEQKPETPKKKARSSYKVFMSYRRSDSADIAGRIYDFLIERLGSTSVFKDVDSINLGANFKQVIDKTMSKCHVIVVILGPRWYGGEGERNQIDNPNDYVRLEVEYALEKNLVIIPAFVQGVSGFEIDRLPESIVELAYYNGLQIRPDPDFRNDMDRLISAIEDAIAQRSKFLGFNR